MKKGWTGVQVAKKEKAYYDNYDSIFRKDPWCVCDEPYFEVSTCMDFMFCEKCSLQIKPKGGKITITSTPERYDD